MPLPKPTADNYERLYPETGVGEAQAQERMERKVFKAEPGQHLRTGRNRGIVVPRIPYLERDDPPACCRAGAVAHPDPCPWHGKEAADGRAEAGA